ncbi:hypothetical protein FHS18_005423 [Paenibacillus phyllosphaerae]|uniref:Uncharacterized protein n=1 Tax=Paenibacillus phyllosphaerae TaxID=274593 RepID=A0A7W5B3L2_9BACL|nr:hypothetical protein [Paenibacillus phyllosphaerae]MBB3113311.1 hypothetical protein [Paenibacillus phyllosphaerae]
MSRLYLNHYWSLFADYIDGFGELAHHGIPLPLLANFYRYLDEQSRALMSEPDFNTVLRHEISDIGQIQPLFDRYVDAIKRTPKKQPRGKILINGTYHRFSPDVFLQHFAPETTLLLSRGKPYMGIPIVTLAHYEPDTADLIERSIRKAENLFNTFSGHPIFGNPYFKEKVLQEIPLTIKALAATERMLDANPVSCFLAGTTEDLISRAVVLKGAARGIPSVCLQHGVIMGEEAFLPAFATKQAVYGQYESEWYTGRGVRPESIEVIGHPRYDAIFTDGYKPEETFLKQTSCKAGTFKILLATQPLTDKSAVQEAVKQLASLGQVEIIVKPHPWEVKKGYAQAYMHLADMLPNVKQFPLSLQLYDVLPHVDLVIMNNSTVGLEAMLYGKPVVVFLDHEPEREYPYYEQLIPYVAATTDRLVTLVQQLMTDPLIRQDAAAKAAAFVGHSYPVRMSGRKLRMLLNRLCGCPDEPRDQLFREGLLFKGAAHADVYLLQHGCRRRFATVQLFQQHGFRWEQVIQLDDRLITRIPLGNPITTSPSEGKSASQCCTLLPNSEGLIVKGAGPELYKMESGLRRLLVGPVDAELLPQALFIDDKLLQRIPKGPVIGPNDL